MRTRPLIRLAMCSGALLCATTYSIASPPDLIECMPSRLYDCVANTDDCDSIPVSNIQGVHLLKIDLRGMRSDTFEGGKKIAGTRIDRVKQEEQLLFLYGFEINEKDERSAHSWNAIINMQNGRLTVTRVSDGVGAVMHGSCKIGKVSTP